MRVTVGVCSAFERHPVVAAVGVGGLLRLVAAFSGCGWFAMDDYAHVIDPAWRWLADPSRPHSSAIRTEFFARVFSRLLAAAHALGASDPAGALHIAYAFLGLWSLLAIPAVYVLARSRLDERTARYAAWLTAGYAILPRVSTRALIEVVAIPPFVWSLALLALPCANSRRRCLAIAGVGGALLAISSLMRMQIAVVGPAVFFVLAWRAVSPPTRTTEGNGRVPEANNSFEGITSEWITVVGFVLGSAAVIALQGAFDIGAGRAPFATYKAYFAFNLSHSSLFGRSPWYTYLLQLLVYAVAPMLLVTARPMWRASMREPLIFVPLVTFVAAHSLVPHKEDRFLFPVLPLVLVLIAAGLSALRSGCRLERAALRLFLCLNGAGLVIALLSDADRNLTEPLLALHREGKAQSVATIGIAQVPKYYLGSTAKVTRYRSIGEFEQGVRQHGYPSAVLLGPALTAAHEPAREVMRHLRGAGLICDPVRVCAGDIVDRILVRLNPSHNKRRGAISLLRCSGAAQPQPQPQPLSQRLTEEISRYGAALPADSPR